MATYEANCSICGTRYGSTDRRAVEKLLCFTCQAPGEARACAECAKPFKATHPAMRICRDCWYQATIGEAETRFEALAASLERAGLPAGEVLQSGGMVMLWQVTLERDSSGRETRYLVWSDPDDGADDLPRSFSYYWAVYDAEANAGRDEHWCSVVIDGATLDDCAAQAAAWVRTHGLADAHDQTLENESEVKP